MFTMLVRIDSYYFGLIAGIFDRSDKFRRILFCSGRPADGRLPGIETHHRAAHPLDALKSLSDMSRAIAAGHPRHRCRRGLACALFVLINWRLSRHTYCLTDKIQLTLTQMNRHVITEAKRRP